MIRHRTIANTIASSLRLDISLGKLKPGVPLRQTALAERFSVSRIPVRDALRSLELDGIVELVPNRGAFVLRLSLQELREITDLRILIEGDLICCAVAALSPTDLANLRAAEWVRAGEPAASSWVAADLAFHEALYRPSKRLRELALFRSLRLAVRNYEAFYHLPDEQRKTILADHEAILNACLLGEAHQAQRILIDHIRREGDLLVECVDRISPQAKVRSSPSGHPN